MEEAEEVMDKKSLRQAGGARPLLAYLPDSSDLSYFCCGPCTVPGHYKPHTMGVGAVVRASVESSASGPGQHLQKLTSRPGRYQWCNAMYP